MPLSCFNVVDFDQQLHKLCIGLPRDGYGLSPSMGWGADYLHLSCVGLR